MFVVSQAWVDCIRLQSLEMWDMNTLKQMRPIQPKKLLPFISALPEPPSPLYTASLTHTLGWILIASCSPQPQLAALWVLLDPCCPPLLQYYPAEERLSHWCFFHTLRCLAAYRIPNRDSVIVWRVRINSTLIGSLSKFLSPPDEYSKRNRKLKNITKEIYGR